MTSYQIWQILPYFDLKMQISRERFIQSWQTIPFFSSLNQTLFDRVTHFSAFGHPKIDVVRVPPLSLLTPQMEGYFGVLPRMQGSWHPFSELDYVYEHFPHIKPSEAHGVKLFITSSRSLKFLSSYLWIVFEILIRNFI